MNDEFDSTVDTSFDDTPSDITDSSIGTDSVDVGSHLDDTVDASEYADDFFDSSTDVESLMSDVSDTDSITTMDTVTDVDASDVVPLVDDIAGDSTSDIEALMADTGEDESSFDTAGDLTGEFSDSPADVEALMDDTSDVSAVMDDLTDLDSDDQSISGEYGESATDITSLMDDSEDTDVYQATPNSDIQIVQEDGSVDTLENIMAANADTETDTPADVEPYQATPNSDIQIVQEDDSVDSLANIMAENADADTDVTTNQATEGLDAIPAYVDEAGITAALTDIESPSQKVQEEIDRIVGNQNLSASQKTALLTEIKDSLPHVAEAKPIQETFAAEIESVDDGVPVKVLTLGGNGTGISHHDYQQELADLDQEITDWNYEQQAKANALSQEISRIMNDPNLSNSERDMLLEQAEHKRLFLEKEWDVLAAQYAESRDLLQQKMNDSMQGFQGINTFQETIESPAIAKISDVAPEIQKLEDVSGWVKDINPNFDPYDWDSPYCNNCGSCAFAVEQRFEGNSDIVATSQNVGTVEEMNALTGMEQVAMTPDEIHEYLVSQGPGAHGIVGIDRVSGPGHWFNAYYDGQKVVAIDGQTGEVNDWPPDYGDVTNWDISVRKEDR